MIILINNNALVESGINRTAAALIDAYRVMDKQYSMRGILERYRWENKMNFGISFIISMAMRVWTLSKAQLLLYYVNA